MIGKTELRTGQLLAAISNMVVGVYAEYVGRGPTKARAIINGDVVLCLLEDTLTKAERSLRESGRNERLLEVRSTLQETMHEALVSGMERLVGREVRGLISGAQLEPDLAAEVFILGKSISDNAEAGVRIVGETDGRGATGPMSIESQPEGGQLK